MACDIRNCNSFSTHVVTLGTCKFSVCSEHLPEARRVMLEAHHAGLDFQHSWEEKIFALPTKKKEGT